MYKQLKIYRFASSACSEKTQFFRAEFLALNREGAE